MSFNSNKARMEYVVSNITVLDYTFNFEIFDETDLLVYKVPKDTLADDNLNKLILTTDYSVTINGDLGGFITLSVAPVLDDVLVIQRNLPISRDYDYVSNGGIYANDLNGDQNVQTYLIADESLATDRALQLPISLTGTSVVLESPLPKAVIRWSDDGTKLINDAALGLELDEVADLVTFASEWASAPHNVLVDDGINTPDYSAYSYSVDAKTSETNAVAGSDNVDARLDTVQTNTHTVEENLSTITSEPVATYLAEAETNATNAQLAEWNSEASKLTADSYATQTEDVLVNVYTSNGDGTYTATPTTVYSALHYAAKSQVLTTLNALTDVTITTATVGDALVYDASGDWINGKVLGMPSETGHLGKSVTTDGVEGDSFWSFVNTNPIIMDTDQTMTAGTSASVVSGFTIADGITLTIPDGSTLTVV